MCSIPTSRKLCGDKLLSWIKALQLFCFQAECCYILGINLLTVLFTDTHLKHQNGIVKVQPSIRLRDWIVEKVSIIITKYAVWLMMKWLICLNNALVMIRLLLLHNWNLCSTFLRLIIICLTDANSKARQSAANNFIRFHR